jgi:hypothetical protein
LISGLWDVKAVPWLDLPRPRLVLAKGNLNNFAGTTKRVRSEGPTAVVPQDVIANGNTRKNNMGVICPKFILVNTVVYLCYLNKATLLRALLVFFPGLFVYKLRGRILGSGADHPQSREVKTYLLFLSIQRLPKVSSDTVQHRSHCLASYNLAVMDLEHKVQDPEGEGHIHGPR